MCFRVHEDLQHDEVRIDTRDSGSDVILVLLSAVDGLLASCAEICKGG